MGLFFVAGLYALTDAFFVRPYLPLEAPPAAPFLLVGTLTAFAAWQLGQGAPGSSVLLSVLAVAACVAATHPIHERTRRFYSDRET